MRNESGVAEPARSEIGEKDSRHDADERREDDRNERGYDRPVDHRQRTELAGDRVPGALPDERRPKRHDRRPRPEHELDEEADNQQRKEYAAAVNDRGEAAIGGTNETRYAPKPRLAAFQSALHLLERRGGPGLHVFRQAARSPPTWR